MFSVFLVLVVTLDSFLCHEVNPMEAQKYCVINTDRCEYRIELHDQNRTEQDEKESLINRVDALEKELQSLKLQSPCNGSDNQSLGICMGRGNGCPESFIPFRQSCYGFSRFATIHKRALEHCSHLYGSHLVQVADEAVLYFLRWNGLTKEDKSYWTGAKLHNRTWFWGHDRSPVTYNMLERVYVDPWSHNFGKSCAVIKLSRDELVPVFCSDVHRMICETKRFSL